MMEAESYQNNKSRRLSEIAKEFNISVLTITNFLRTKGYTIENNPMARLRNDCYMLVSNEYQSEKVLKEEAKRVKMLARVKKENIRLDNIKKKEMKQKKLVPPKDEFKYTEPNSELEVKPISHTDQLSEKPINLKIIGKIDLDKLNIKTKPARKPKTITEEKQKDIETHEQEEIIEPEITDNIQIKSDLLVETPEKINDNQTINSGKQNNTQRLSKVAKELDVKINTITEFLKSKGYLIEKNPMTKISDDLYILLSKEFRQREEKEEIDKKPFYETFLIDFKHLKFVESGVIFNKWFWQISESLELKIDNMYIHKEFDSIKNYFQNTLGIQEIKVEIKAENQNKFPSIKDMIITSGDIQRINKNLIDTIRLSFIKKIIRNKSLSKSAFTVDKLFELVPNELKTNAFYKDDRELLEDILSIENRKHYHHLKYLSSKQSTSFKMHYLFKPYSFIFFLEGEEKNYFVWETLDTKEATYIWQIDKDPDSLIDNFKKIEAKIDSLLSGGKIKYIKSTDDSVKRIKHLYSGVDKGYPKWRFELDGYTK